jgi:DNA-binding CsgD family transcriptional regulator
MTLARQDDTHPLSVFGVFMGGVNLVFAAATVLAVLLYRENYFGAATLAIGILLALYVLVMTYSVATNAWYRRMREEKALEGPEGKSGEASDASTDSLSPEQLLSKSIATHYQLTERERDVLHLMTQGRDVPTIARQLFITENTVRTHTKSIYLKLDIHSKQGLLDLVQRHRA